MQYKVPQNVDIEDRVFGPLSMRQFMIILIGAGIILFLFFIMQGPLRPIFYIFAIIIGGGFVMMATAKYGSQNFEDFLESALKTLTLPRKRVWKKYEDIPQMVKTENKKKNEMKPAEKKLVSEVHDDLGRLAELVDSGGNLPMSAKDRVIPFGTHLENEQAADLLASSDDNRSHLDNLLETAGKKAPKREPLISEEAKLSPTKSFKYPEVDTFENK